MNHALSRTKSEAQLTKLQLAGKKASTFSVNTAADSEQAGRLPYIKSLGQPFKTMP
jgi:hypothetical protein